MFQTVDWVSQLLCEIIVSVKEISTRLILVFDSVQESHLPCIHSTVWVYSVDSILLSIKIIKELRPFQDDLSFMYELEPDDRKIVWLFDPLVNMSGSWILNMVQYFLWTRKILLLFSLIIKNIYWIL